MRNVSLSGWQVFNLTTIYIIGTTFLLLPGNLIADAKQYGWIVSLWSLLFCLLMAVLWLYLSSRFPGLSIVQIAVHVLGKWAGGAVSLLYVLFFIQLSAWITRNLSDFMQINLMPETPIPVFSMMILLVCAYTVVKGLDAIAMISELLGTYVNLAFWVPLVFMLKEWDWKRFDAPAVFHPWETFLHTSYALQYPYMELVAFMMIFPYRGQRFKRNFISGIVAAGILLSLCSFLAIGILGVERSSHLIYPVFIIFREMQFTNFVEHVEAIIAVNILLIVCIKISLLFYCAVLAICQLFDMNNRAVIAYPLVWIIAAYSLLFHSVVDYIEWIRKYALSYSSLFAIIIPVILLVCGRLRGEKVSHRSESTP